MHYFVENYELRRVSLPTGFLFGQKPFFFWDLFFFFFGGSNRYLHWRNSVVKFRLEIHKINRNLIFPNFVFLGLKKLQDLYKITLDSCIRYLAYLINYSAKFF
jgi:hypothetical protein